MSGIAQHLLATGHIVGGSDRTTSAYTQMLQELGIEVQGESASVADYQLIVRTSAVKEDHPQIAQANKLGIPVVLREEVLGHLFDKYPTRIAICGTHGKTTVTAMVHHILQRCNLSHTAFIGGSYLGRNYFAGENIVVAEACEYNASFLHMHPTHTLCLNVEYDHPDCYGSLKEVQNAFCQLFRQSQRVILPQELQKLCTNGVCYNQFSAQNVFATNKGTTFDLYHNQTFVSRCKMPLVGAHNVTNAICAVALCHQLHLPLMEVCHALSTFAGVDRRWTPVPYKCKLFCDYAHHPTEICASIQSAKSITKGRVVCLFQPHTYTRTKAFWKQFAKCFSQTTVVYLPIYPAREKPIDGVTSQNLAQFTRELDIDAHYCADFCQAKQFIENVTTSADTVLILGAGDIVEMAKIFAT